MKKYLVIPILFLLCCRADAQTDSVIVSAVDTVLRITDLNPFFTVHVDSSFSYQLQINKNPSDYFWYLKNAPVGIRINKETGLVTFKADKSYFLSGKLKYDVNYNVRFGVQNLYNPQEKLDTTFTIIFYNTEIVPSRVKPTVSNVVFVDEGEKISFRILCENGNFPIETILTLTSIPINNYKGVQQCGDEFSWSPGYDFVKESDKEKSLTLSFIGTSRFQIRDTAIIKLVVRDALNFPLASEEYKQTVKNINKYILQLKYTFLQLDKSLKKTKTARTTFDLTSASTTLTGTIMSASNSEDAQKAGKILPSIGLSLVPIKEATVPNKPVDQNQAVLIRTSIKRLDYMLQDNQLIGEKDPDIIKKNNKLRDELKQVQIQLIEVPIELTNEMSEEELNRYFNNPKVNKKYRLKAR